MQTKHINGNCFKILFYFTKFCCGLENWLLGLPGVYKTRFPVWWFFWKKNFLKILIAKVPMVSCQVSNYLFIVSTNISWVRSGFPAHANEIIVSGYQNWLEKFEERWIFKVCHLKRHSHAAIIILVYITLQTCPIFDWTIARNNFCKVSEWLTSSVRLLMVARYPFCSVHLDSASAQVSEM